MVVGTPNLQEMNFNLNFSYYDFLNQLSYHETKDGKLLRQVLSCFQSSVLINRASRECQKVTQLTVWLEKRMEIVVACYLLITAMF